MYGFLFVLAFLTASDVSVYTNARLVLFPACV